MRWFALCFGLGIACAGALAQDRPATLPGTEPLTTDKQLDVLMVEGLDRFCLKEIEKARGLREGLWKRDYASPDAYEKSLAPYRDKFRTIIGAVDPRVAGANADFRPAEKDSIGVQSISWPVLKGVTAEGVALVPPGAPKGILIAIPDSRWPADVVWGADRENPVSRLPEVFARNGFLVIVPSLINRDDTFSGNPEIAMTNQTHREWVYRSAFEMGRHVIGYEVQKILAAVDLCQNSLGKKDPSDRMPVAIAGVGDGGQLALYSAALDPRISAVMVSGYFQPREGIWQEPIDRNVWNLLTEFGDAEIAGMIAPRPLVIEACAIPETEGPLAAKQGRRGGAAPGRIKTADMTAVKAEFQKAQAIYEKLNAQAKVQLIASGADGRGSGGGDVAIKALASATGVSDMKMDGSSPKLPELADQQAIQKRQVEEAIEFTQKVLRQSYKTRDKLFAQADRSSLEKYVASAEKLRDYVYRELIGKLPEPTMPMNPRTRKVLDEKEYTGYEVVLDTYPDVIAAGILLLPTDLKPGEKRPVVVCQHGLEGVPMDTISGPGSAGYPYYKSFAAELAKQGFITYAPQNPYRGKDLFRTLQRKSNPLGRSLFSYIIPQHLVTLRWLSTLPNVDKDRIGFYGLSYGGKTAVRVPPMLPPRDNDPGYCLSICSADYNEWVSKNASTDAPFAYVFTGEYEIFEWNMGHVANYAELSMLMTPRPFMVERGHDDGVGIDEWVAWEFAKVRRHYNKLGIGDKTEIEFFNGPHTINGQATYDFLHRHLQWPKR